MKPRLRLSTKHLPVGRGHKQIVLDFAAKHRFVYFGAIDHLASEGVVRGATLSIGGKDSHFSIGSYKGYDVAFVERRIDPDERLLIMQFDLHAARDVPHVFISLLDFGERFYRQLFIKYPHLRPLGLGASAQYDPAFLTRYHVYSAPAHALAVEQLFTPDVTGLISKHFGRLAVEVSGQSLFIYSEPGRVTASLLEAMLENGAWLASKIDSVETF